MPERILDVLSRLACTNVCDETDEKIVHYFAIRILELHGTHVTCGVVYVPTYGRPVDIHEFCRTTLKALREEGFDV